MSEKSKKLAAARKKLKEYQSKEKHHEQEDNELKKTENITTKESSNVLNPIDNAVFIETSKENQDVVFDMEIIDSAVVQTEIINRTQKEILSIDVEDNSRVGTIELLVGEKATLSAALAKSQNECKERVFELEELNTRLNMTCKRVEQLEKDTMDLQTKNSNMNRTIEQLNASVLSKEDDLTKTKFELDEKIEYAEELKRELNAEIKKREQVEQQLKEKQCEVELNQIRINQISDEATVAVDGRVEILMQTKFMHEQQIRDLQAMVQQLGIERDQSNNQYQNYVQNLNKEMANLSEKNIELTEENTRLVHREQSLIQHIGDLEKQIQQSIAKQEAIKANISVESSKPENNDERIELEEKISNLLKKGLNQESIVKDLETELNETNQIIVEKNEKIEELEKRIENLLSEMPNSSKLLASIESDKIAASRAVSQNEQLKKQLDEVQLKLIQVTNDKVELVNLIDSEQHANREIKINYAEMEEKIKVIEDKLHFKDEEMIRLTHENNELNKKILQQSQELDRLKHYEANEYLHNKLRRQIENNFKIHSEGLDDKNGEGNISISVPIESAEEIFVENDTVTIVKNSEENPSTVIATSEAMQKLEERFKSLMGEVADLTDEKQRLEHLVLQLQGETETIGEYIALYQTQRRVLKQREIEKNTQLHLLITEREELREKLSQLNQLVSSLVNNNTQNLIKSELDNNVRRKIDNNTFAPTNGGYVPPENGEKVIEENSACSVDQTQLVKQIHTIISEIKQNDIENNFKITPSVDHCLCCSGKFETI